MFAYGHMYLSSFFFSPDPYFQQKLAKREGGLIDRSQDIARLQEFYKLYREKNDVDKLREEEMKLKESGAFSGNLGEYVTHYLNLTRRAFYLLYMY